MKKPKFIINILLAIIEIALVITALVLLSLSTEGKYDQLEITLIAIAITLLFVIGFSLISTIFLLKSKDSKFVSLGCWFTIEALLISLIVLVITSADLVVLFLTILLTINALVALSYLITNSKTQSVKVELIDQDLSSENNQKTIARAQNLKEEAKNYLKATLGEIYKLSGTKEINLGNKGLRHKFIENKNWDQYLLTNAEYQIVIYQLVQTNPQALEYFPDAAQTIGDLERNIFYFKNYDIYSITKLSLYHQIKTSFQLAKVKAKS